MLLLFNVCRPKKPGSDTLEIPPIASKRRSFRNYFQAIQTMMNSHGRGVRKTAPPLSPGGRAVSVHLRGEGIRLNTRETPVRVAMRSKRFLRKLRQHDLNTSYHLAGTCRDGAEGPWRLRRHAGLKVRGLGRRCSVIDAWVMPSSISVPNIHSRADHRICGKGARI